MATYIFLDPNEIVQQQQAIAAAAAAAVNNTTTNNNNIPNLNISNKTSSSNDVSLNEHYFRFFLFYLLRFLSLPYVCVCVYIYSSYVYLANLHVITHY
jgi:hypothetical protein